MAIKNQLDTDVIKKQVNLADSDIPQYYESNELDQFKLKPMPSPYNKGLQGGEPLKLNKENSPYAEAARKMDGS